jgi:hypothetical protein
MNFENHLILHSFPTMWFSDAFVYENCRLGVQKDDIINYYKR